MNSVGDLVLTDPAAMRALADPFRLALLDSLGNAVLLHYVDLPRRWVAEEEPQLALDWVRAAGLFNARVTVTPDELRGIQEGLERLLEPFLTRESDDVPAEAGRVRILSYFMPEPAQAGAPPPRQPT